MCSSGNSGGYDSLEGSYRPLSDEGFIPSRYATSARTIILARSIIVQSTGARTALLSQPPAQTNADKCAQILSDWGYQQHSGPPRGCMSNDCIVECYRQGREGCSFYRLESHSPKAALCIIRWTSNLQTRSPGRPTNFFRAGKLLKHALGIIVLG